ncbi:MAG: ClpXP protease specificity-enhancing factor [Variovorax sp.]|nr:MAG: ClpXP protease specificity-enhancing factor [Variovorax sp.]
MINALESSSTRPYLIRALYEWCTDNGFTPYVAVQVDDSVQVPREYVKNGEIVLNISFDATSSLKLGNDFIEFKARFAGTAREISVPVGRVIAIYARENGQGMAFPAPPAASLASAGGATTQEPVSTLRDASRSSTSTSSEASGDAKIMHLVTGDEIAGHAAAEDSGEQNDPPRPPVGGGAKPSLKRIK